MTADLLPAARTASRRADPSKWASSLCFTPRDPLGEHEPFAVWSKRFFARLEVTRQEAKRVTARLRATLAASDRLLHHLRQTIADSEARAVERSNGPLRAVYNPAGRPRS